ncbi:MAG TPA: DUF1611 domain-containing protein [Candidatus Baltobacteraceae bacterium]|nr:DUF1611 domain-containing protein [Candidatus Baltobacteraceae bacterium]
MHPTTTEGAPRARRYAILTGGLLAEMYGKTAQGVLRYRADEVVAVIDERHAGRRVCDVVPSLRSTAPIVASFDEAAAYEPTSLLIGVATDGGRIPAEFRPTVLRAVDAGLEIVSGLHELLADDDEIVARARRSGSRLWDVRVPPKDIPIFSGAAYALPQDVVLAVGSDCAVGKMTALLEIERAARAAGTRARFAATGQTGIMIAGSGIAVDRVIADFVAGAAEKLTLEHAVDADVVLVEGQGALFHPAYGPVTLGLLYGCAPDVLLLCDRPNSRQIAGFSTAIPDLASLVRSYEELVAHLKPARVAAVALDTSAYDASGAEAIVAATARATGLPVDDPVRNGAARLWAALESALRATPKARARALV